MTDGRYPAPGGPDSPDSALQGYDVGNSWVWLLYHKDTERWEVVLCAAPPRDPASEPIAREIVVYDGESEAAAREAFLSASSVNSQAATGPPVSVPGVRVHPPRKKGRRTPYQCSHSYRWWRRLSDWALRVLGCSGWSFTTYSDRESLCIGRERWVWVAVEDVEVVSDEGDTIRKLRPPGDGWNGWKKQVQLQCACGYWDDVGTGQMLHFANGLTDLMVFNDRQVAEDHVRRLRSGIPDRWPVIAAVLAIAFGVAGSSAAVITAVTRLLENC